MKATIEENTKHLIRQNGKLSELNFSLDKLIIRHKLTKEVLSSQLHNDDKVNLLKIMLLGIPMRDNVFKISTQPVALEFKKKILEII